MQTTDATRFRTDCTSPACVTTGSLSMQGRGRTANRNGGAMQLPAPEVVPGASAGAIIHHVQPAPLPDFRRQVLGEIRQYLLNSPRRPSPDTDVRPQTSADFPDVFLARHLLSPRHRD